MSISFRPKFPGDEDAAGLRELLVRHANLTGSAVAQELLADFHAACSRFLRVVPLEYRQALKRAEGQAA